MSAKPEDLVAEPHSRRRVRWGSVALGSAIVAASLAFPVIHTTETDPRVAECTAGSRPELDAVFVLDSSEPMSTSDPDGLRRSAATAFVNGMNAQARGAVVDFDDRGQVVQGLTTDKADLVAAINTIDNSGGADLDAGIRAALGELASSTSTDRDQVIVVMTDGRGSYDSALTFDAANAGVQIYTVGLGTAVETTLLTALADFTGGTYSHAVPLLGPPADPSEDLPFDADDDGLSDCEEQQGAWDARGQHHVTDARNPDSDGDGLTDGQEVTTDLNSFQATAVAGFLHLPLGAEGFRYVVSDPNDPDTDGDGAIDALEFDIGTDLFVSDTDGDGLGDFEEVNEYGTNPLDENTDGDKRDDGWEVANASSGFSPTIFDEELSKLTYVKDFAAGSACPDGFGFCETDSVAFLAGSIASGFFGVKDVFDVIGNLSTLDFVGAGLAATAIVPIAGDVGGVVSKSVRFLKRVPPQTRADGLAAIARADFPVSARITTVKAVEGDSLRTLTDAGMTDEQVLALMRSRVRLPTIAQGVRGAQNIAKSPRFFPTEREAQNYLAAKTPGALTERSFPCPVCARNSTLGSRKVDVFDPKSNAAIEVKNGFVSLSTTRDEVAKDVALLADPATPIDSVVWHFFPKEGGGVGPDDALRELLESSGIPYVIYLP